MFRSCGRLFRSRTPTQWHVRSISTAKNASLELKKTRKARVSMKQNGDRTEQVTGPRKRGRPKKSTPQNAPTIPEVKDGKGSERRRSTKRVKSKASSSTASDEISNAPSADASPSAVEHRRPHRSKATTPLFPLHLISNKTSRNHHDLPSFLAHAANTNLNPTTTVYKGTHYEYTVASTLAHYNLTLHRTGRSNDLGIDLIGHWTLPAPSRNQKSVELRVLVQCKASAPRPSLVRELDGAYVGAPAGWRGEGVLALLVASKEATRGVREAVQRSRWPMGIMLVSREGKLRQFLWNAEAARVGLEGLGVLVRYLDGLGGGVAVEGDGNADGVAEVLKSGERVQGSLGLSWMGRPWRNGNTT